MKDLLRSMFPGLTSTEFDNVLRNSRDIHHAIEIILSTSSEQVQSDMDVARALAESYAQMDNVPNCTKTPSVYQLYVIDQVNGRHSSA